MYKVVSGWEAWIETSRGVDDMTKLPVEGSAKHLFLDAGAHAKLAVYCLLLAIVKAVIGGYNRIRTKVRMMSDGVCNWYRSRIREIFFCWGTIGWSLAGCMVVLHMYTV